MATRTKAEPEKAEATEEEPEDDHLTEKVEGAVRKVIGSLFGSGELDVEAEDEPEEEPAKEEDAKPASPREQESRMEALVGRAVASLLDTEKQEKKDTAPAKVEETAPGGKGWREKLWGSQ